MNFLAHAYLSFQDREILAGNLISDFVKGKKKFDYASRIQQGISLHRSIDEFTDRHAATRNARNYFKAEYGLYSGAFIDIVYDHFLANDQQAFPNESDLAAFAQSTYQQLDPPGENFPEPFKFMFMHMKKQDWLYHYRFKEGIHNSFAGLVRRSAYMHDPHTAFSLFEKHYEDLARYYQEFFPELKQFAEDLFKKIDSE